MLNNKAFDLWADGYDKTVGISDEKNTYPFAGYKKVLGFIFQTIMKTENAIVLDIGFGTGTLTTKLYEQGCSIYGQDFSSRMIELASEKMPNAHLYQGDFSKELVEPLQNFRYENCMSLYIKHIYRMLWPFCVLLLFCEPFPGIIRRFLTQKKEPMHECIGSIFLLKQFQNLSDDT